MDKEIYEKAHDIQFELRRLTQWIDKCYRITDITMLIRQDGERDATTTIPISDELSNSLKVVIKGRIAELQQEFENL